MIVHQLPSGAQLRLRGPASGRVVLTINGGTHKDVPGRWSASTEYLVRGLARRLPQIGFAEVRYRVRSWKRIEMCVTDGREALAAVAAMGATDIVLCGYSMGGAVSSQIAEHRLVRQVIGLAPWLPDELPVDALVAHPFHVLHGTLDRYLFGLPGVHPANSRAGFDRVIAMGGAGTYRLLPLATHALALRAPWGGLIPAPRAGAWVDGVADLLG